jgi:hypothetical protein
VQDEFLDSFRHAFNTFSDIFGVIEQIFAILRLFSFFPSKLLVADTNRIQREFLSNGGIAPFHTFLASSHPRQNTNLFKPSAPFPCEAGRRAVPSRRRKEGWGEGCLLSSLPPKRGVYAPFLQCFGKGSGMGVRAVKTPRNPQIALFPCALCASAVKCFC